MCLRNCHWLCESQTELMAQRGDFSLLSSKSCGPLSLQELQYTCLKFSTEFWRIQSHGPWKVCHGSHLKTSVLSEGWKPSHSHLVGGLNRPCIYNPQQVMSPALGAPLLLIRHVMSPASSGISLLRYKTCHISQCMCTTERCLLAPPGGSENLLPPANVSGWLFHDRDLLLASFKYGGQHLSKPPGIPNKQGISTCPAPWLALLHIVWV